MKEMVNHPSHYQREGKKECIDEMVDIFGLDETVIWAIITAYKYQYRCGLKDKVEQEIAKIRWYEDWIDRHIDKCSTDTKRIAMRYLDYRNGEQGI